MNHLSSNGQKIKFINLFRSIIHNIVVVIVGLCLGVIGRRLDLLLGISSFSFVFAIAAAWLLLISGFILRLWATFYFYENHMKVISLVPQNVLITSGPYRFSRNPLYLGGNVFIFFGAVLLFGSPSGIVLTVINIFGVDMMIRREEKQLEKNFGEEWIRYKKRVRRWF